jgi:hypothetical protein
MGLPAKEFLLTGFFPFTVSTCIGPKAIYVCPGLADFLKRLSMFADITVWSSMMESLTK